MRLPDYEANCIPDGFHPDRKIAEDDLAIDLRRPGTIKIVQHVNREALSRQQARRFCHTGVPAA